MKLLLVLVSFILGTAQASVLREVRSLAGLHERQDRAELRRMLGIDPVRVPWCGALLREAVERAGRKPPEGAERALAWRRYGRAVRPQPGAIAVMRGHVTVAQSIRRGRVCGWGGNQSNRVRLSCYPLRRVVAWRM